MTLSRRDWLRLSSLGVVGTSLSGWFAPLARAAAADPQRRRSCILLWMSGGPSQMDTFDLKPGHANGGPYKEIATAAPGVKISEHLPKLAKKMDRIALVRSMASKEGDHALATVYNHTGYQARGPVQYPTFGSLMAKELGDEASDLPAFVSVAPFRAFGAGAVSPGFLGPRYAPLVVGAQAAYAAPGQNPAPERSLAVENLAPAHGRDHFEARLRLLREAQRAFAADHPDAPSRSHETAYERAARLMQTRAAKAFDLDDEPAALRDAYGRTTFGQGCLLARRLVERGVPFVEVTLGGSGGIGWDTHVNNFDAVRELSGQLDGAWATLMDDLQKRGLLDSTLIVWMGEFGRTPKINGNKGRDHYPNAWTAALAGGGIKGGQAVGKTAPGGETVVERPASVPDLLATVCKALGVDAEKQNVSNTGRPIAIVEKAATPIAEVLA